MTLSRAKSFLAAATLALSATPALSDGLSDAQILAIYSQVNSFDIETALIGELMGQSDQVRALGAMVSGDHTGVRAAAHQLALQLDILPALPPSRIEAAIDHDQVVASLRGAGPDGFDAAYLRHEIAFHRAAIAAVETLLLPEADAPELKAHFEAVLPHFRHHLQATIEAAEALGVEVTN